MNTSSAPDYPEQPVAFYTPDQVAEMFQTKSSWWICEGVRRGRWTCARGPRKVMRFSLEHVRQIKAAIEQDAPSQVWGDISVFGATTRSVSRNQSRRTG